MGPDELAEMAVVARRHYLEGASRTDIAKERGLSRFKVGRILTRALETGVVRIQIEGPADVDVETSESLRRTFGLRRAFAVRTEDEVAVHDALGRVAGALLAEVVTEEDVLGFDCGRTLRAMANRVNGIARCEVVQLTGMGGTAGETSVDICRAVTDQTGGLLRTVFAPIVLRDAAARASLTAEPSIRSTLDRYDAVTTAVIAIGAWAPGLSQVRPLLTGSEQEELARAGVVGETCALLFDSDGRPVPGLEHRRIGVTAEQLRAVRHVVAVAGGRGKDEAVAALLGAGLVGTLVTDVHLARRLLQRDAAR